MEAAVNEAEQQISGASVYIVFCIPVLAAEMTTGSGALNARKRSINFLIFNYFYKSLSICKRLDDIIAMHKGAGVTWRRNSAN